MFSNKYFYIFNIIFIIITCYLAIWQFNRYNYKINKTENFQTSFKNIEKLPQINDLDQEYKVYQAKGNFDFSKQIILAPRQYEGKVGKYIYTLFYPNNRAPILVNRGFVADGNLEKLEIQGKSDLVEIILVSKIAQKKSWFMPENDPENNMWIYINMTEISNHLAENLANIYFDMAVDDKKNFNQLPVEIIDNSHIFFNPHLKYIFFWSLMSLSLVILLIIYRYQDGKKYKRGRF